MPTARFVSKAWVEERVATLQIEGPTIETKQFEVRTRPGETIRVPDYKRLTEPDLITIYGASFEHVAGPTRPIEGVVRDQDTGKPLAGIMVRGEHSLGNPIVYVQSITDAKGHYRLVGLPRGREGDVVAVPPCDFRVVDSVKAELNIPADKELPYLAGIGDGRNNSGNGTSPARHQDEARRLGHRTDHRSGHPKTGPRPGRLFRLSPIIPP